MKNTQFERTDRRQCLRIEYRSSERPVLQVGKSKFEILDLNEKGLAMQLSNNAEGMELKDNVIGLILFKSGWQVGIEGHVKWNNENVVGIEFISPISRDAIIREHKLRFQKFQDK